MAHNKLLNNKIGSEGAKAIGKALSKNESLTQIDLCGKAFKQVKLDV